MKPLDHGIFLAAVIILNGMWMIFHRRRRNAQLVAKGSMTAAQEAKSNTDMIRAGRFACACGVILGIFFAALRFFG